ncbi:hypothetical protein ACN28I_27445 [Archangium gephyra]|uniref:hypothetical protein n=1 Tax=Archangium gephyra TaxID=48 RepID=UPI003B770929
MIADPPAFTLPYEGVPKLSALDENIVKRTDDTSYLEVRCLAQHIPNGKDGSVIEFRLSEYFMDQTEPIFLAGLPFRYDLSKAKGGLCDSRGWVMARLQHDEVIKRIPNQGRFRLEARVLQNEKANRSIELPVIHKDIGTSPRRLEGTMVYGLHKNVSREFRQKVLAICSFLKMNPDHLMACMALETAGTFSPSIQNSGGSRAFGLIQFTAGPVKDIDPNLKLETLAAMSAVQQLDYVQAYFVPFVKKAPLTNIGDVYMAILCQRGVGQPPDYVCYKKGQNGYAGNASLDVGPNGKPKGYITKGDATARAERWLAEGQLLRG